MPFFRPMTRIFEKTALSPRRVIRWNIFEINILISKYILDRSESTPIKNNLTWKFHSEIFFFAIFWPKMDKNRNFEDIWLKKFFTLFLLFLLKLFIAIILSDHTRVPLDKYRWDIPSEQIHSTILPPHQELMNLVWLDTRTGIGTWVWSCLRL